MNLKIFRLLVGLIFLFSTFTTLSQDFNAGTHALVNKAVQNQVVKYSVVLNGEYQEANTLQHVARWRKISGSEITITVEANTIYFSVDPTKFSETDLDTLISGIIILNGYRTYEVQ